MSIRAIWVLVIAASLMIIMSSAPAQSQAPKIVYDDNDSFVVAVKECAKYHNSLLDNADHIPVEIVAAMAVLETVMVLADLPMKQITCLAFAPGT